MIRTVLVVAVVAGAEAHSQEVPGDTTAFRVEPCPFWSQEQSSRYHVSCGKLLVAQSDTGGRRLELAVAILHSLGDRLSDDAVVVIPGGPGEDIVRTAQLLARHPLQDSLRQHRDIVLLDPRGTGYSDPGELCPAFATLDRRVAILRLPFAERTALVRRELAVCRARLLEQGLDPAHFEAVAMADDLERLRRALGYSALDLIGLSWGTRVALETMRRHPASVRSAILYGPYATDASGTNAAAGRSGPALERLFRACGADAACHREFPDLSSQLHAAVASLDSTPVPLSTPWGPMDVDGSVAAIAVTYSLYQSEFLPYVPLAVSELGRGNVAFVEVFLHGAIGEGSSGGSYYAAYCSERAPPVGTDSLERLRTHYPWADAIDRFAPDPAVVCPAFVAGSADTLLLQPVASDIPTLIFVGELDPTTPVESGQRIAAEMPNAQLVVLRGRGHNVNVPTPCTVRMRRAFIDDPAGALDTSCAETRSLAFITRVHANPGVPRLLSRLVIAPRPVLSATVVVTLLALLAGALLLPRRVIHALRTGRRSVALAIALPWTVALLATAFSLALAAAIAFARDRFLPMFGVSDSWKWIFGLLPVVLGLAAVAAVVLVVGWARPWWTPRTRAIAAMTTVAGITFGVLVLQLGFVSPR